MENVTSALATGLPDALIRNACAETIAVEALVDHEQLDERGLHYMTHWQLLLQRFLHQSGDLVGRGARPLARICSTVSSLIDHPDRHLVGDAADILGRDSCVPPES